MSRILTLAMIPLLLSGACASPGRSGPRARIGDARAGDVPVELYTAADGTPAVEPSRRIPAGKMVCAMERPIGSNIAERVCRYQERLDEERDRLQEAMTNRPRAPVCGPSCPLPGGNAGLP
jgi:hypothetical protein